MSAEGTECIIKERRSDYYKLKEASKREPLSHELQICRKLYSKKQVGDVIEISESEERILT